MSSFTLIISNSDAKIKFLRVFEYLTLFSEEYLNPDKEKVFSQDMLYAYKKIKRSRKLLRILFSLWNLRKILEYSNKDKLFFLKWCYLLSKFTGVVFHSLESITALTDIMQILPNFSKKLKFFRFSFWIGGLILSNVYCITYLIHSYGKEAHLKDACVNNLKPIEIIQIMNTLAEERHDLILKICCNFMDFFIGCHYAKVIERFLKTRVTNGVLGSVGMICTVLRIFILMKKRQRKNTSDEDGHELFDGLFYGYD